MAAPTDAFLENTHGFAYLEPGWKVFIGRNTGLPDTVWQLPYIPEAEMEMQGYSSKVKELSWHVSGGYVATNCGAEIVLWDMRGEGPKRRRSVVMQGHVGKLTKVKFQRFGDLIASTDLAGLILIRHPNNKDISVKGHRKLPSARWSGLMMMKTCCLELQRER